MKIAMSALSIQNLIVIRNFYYWPKFLVDEKTACRVLKFGTACVFLIPEFSYLNGRSLEMSKASILVRKASNLLQQCLIITSTIKYIYSSVS